MTKVTQQNIIGPIQQPGARLLTTENGRVSGVGWRVRLTGHFEVAFDITIDDGETWTTTHSWHRPTASDIVRAGYAAAAQYPGARLTEFEEVNGVWIPRIEEEEAE